MSQFFLTADNQRDFIRKVAEEFPAIQWVCETDAGSASAMYEIIPLISVLSFEFERTADSRTDLHVWPQDLAPGIPALCDGPVSRQWLRANSLLLHPDQTGLILFSPSVVEKDGAETLLLSGRTGRMSKGDYEYERFVKDPEALIRFADKLERRLRKYYNDRLKRILSGWDNPDERWPTTLYHVSNEAYEMYRSGVKLKVSGTPQYLYVEEP